MKTIIIKPIKIRDEQKPLICLITQLLAFCALVVWCFGIAVVAKDPELHDHFSKIIGNAFVNKYMEVCGGAIIGSMSGLLSTLFFCYKLTYKYTKQDWEQNQKKAMGSGLFDKETHLFHTEMLLRFEQSQLTIEEKTKEREREIQKKLLSLEKLKKGAINGDDNENDKGRKTKGHKEILER